MRYFYIPSVSPVRGLEKLSSFDSKTVFMSCVLAETSCRLGKCQRRGLPSLPYLYICMEILLEILSYVCIKVCFVLDVCLELFLLKYFHFIHFKPRLIKKFNDTLNTFYLRLYGKGPLLLLHGLLINCKGSFICTSHRLDNTSHRLDNTTHRQDNTSHRLDNTSHR